MKHTAHETGDLEAQTNLNEKSTVAQDDSTHSGNGRHIDAHVSFSTDVVPNLQGPKHSGSFRFSTLNQSMPPGTLFSDLIDEDDFTAHDSDSGTGGADAFQKKAQWLCRSSGRPDHVHKTIAKARASMRFIESQQGIKSFLSLSPSMQSLQHDEHDLKQVASHETKSTDDKDEEMTLTVKEFSFDLDDLLDSEARDELIKESEYIHRVLETVNKVQKASPRRGHQIEVRLKNFDFVVPTATKEQNFVANVWNQSIFYAVFEFFRRVDRVLKYKRKKRQRQSLANKSSTEVDLEEINELDRSERSHRRLFPKSYRKVLDDVNICLKPGRMYLVLGSPGSGKTSFLKAIAGLLPHTHRSQRVEHGIRAAKPYTDGVCQYNGLTMKNDAGFDFTNAISFVTQNDEHAARLTVKETFDFAFQCRAGGTVRPRGMKKTEQAEKLIEKLDKEGWNVDMVLEGLGLSHVADTFVGDANVRGVSGGQRRRVTAGEMMQSQTPIMCADEISNGLDAASTYDIIRSFLHFTKVLKRTRVVSLLQPSPETFGLFDEVILLSEGKIIYSGPTEEVVDYFQDLGYMLPARMDVADFLQSISTPDGAELFHPRDPQQKHYTPTEFANIFKNSSMGRSIEDALDAPHALDWADISNASITVESAIDKSIHGSSLQDLVDEYRVQYQNSFLRSVWLTFSRQFLLWRRDRRFVIANFAKNVIMGISVGAVFWQTDNAASIFGVMFQGMLFIMLGAMTAAPQQISDRVIYYKQADANFYQTFAYVTGRFLALTPQSLLDVLTFGTLLYWMVGLVPTSQSYFIFIATLFVFNLAMNNMFSIFTSILSTQAAVQGIAAFILFLCVLFSGFIVTPDVIPVYYIWLYWWNPMAWAYRALLLNEYLRSDAIYDEILNTVAWGQIRLGDAILLAKGFVAPDGGSYGLQWIAFSFAYLVPYIILCVWLTGLGLKLIRVEEHSEEPIRNGDTESEEYDSASEAEEEEGEGEEEKGASEVSEEAEEIDLPFVPVDLTFKDICYEVSASKKKEKLKLLNNVSGKFGSGRMCALMGTSGAGKTTLMDVIAMRKSSGTVTGEVKLNGFPQERVSFRRCSAYVEQFDVQSAELTVRETIAFSARLRLDPSIESMRDDEAKMKFVDKIIDMFELSKLKDSQVGGGGSGGGLTFEQRKRLSVAVEFAASPSVLFLDEPTTGLDSRAALLVMKSLKLVAQTGRTIVATVHQPSSAAFAMFDDLLLLKKGGEVVFHGDLGEKSSHLIRYFESNGANRIEHGENPSTWMLTVLGDPSKNWSEIYQASQDKESIDESIEETNDNPNEDNKVTYKDHFACSFRKRNRLINWRLNLIYWRSPAYNLGRVAISVIISFILGSVFLTNRKPEYFLETEMSSRLSTIFIAFIIMGVLSIITVLPVMNSIRDVYYRQRLAGMLEHGSLSLALGVAEKKYIVLVSSLFVVIFYFTMGLANDIRKFIAFWAFFTFNVAIYSYFGQAFMCLVPGMATAQILCSVFIGLNNFFSGLIVRPQYMTGLWSFTFWITPGHYVYEGLVASQFHDDETPVIALAGSQFFIELGCTVGQLEVCEGPVKTYVDVFFGGKYIYENILMDALVLGAYLTFARILTWFALKKFNYAYS